MEKQQLSDKYSLFIRKFILGPIFLIIGGIMIIRLHFTSHIVVGSLFFLVGLFYLNLRNIAFDDQLVYIDRKKYRYNQIQKIGGIEVNLLYFPALRIVSGNRTFWYFTDVGQAGIFRLLLGVIFPSLDPFKAIRLFKEQYELRKKVSD